MRLYEIIDTEFGKKTKLFTKPNIKKTSPGYLGSGAYGVAYMDPKDPHRVKKVSNQDVALKDDAYFKYIDAVGKYRKEHGVNQYFPQVYKIEEIKNIFGKGVNYEISMEPLVRLQDVETDALISIVERLTGQPEDTNRGTTFAEPYRKDSYIEKIERLVSYGINGENLGMMADEEFVKAAKFIQELKKTHKLRYDIHSGNLMIRRYPLHLVITDPVF